VVETSQDDSVTVYQALRLYEERCSEIDVITMAQNEEELQCQARK
jgi:hypothetical protein